MGPMPRAEANGIELEYETFGDRGAAPLLLIRRLPEVVDAIAQLAGMPSLAC